MATTAKIRLYDPVKTNLAKAKGGIRLYDTPVTATPPAVNKFGADVSAHPYNPLNPKNVLNEPAPQVSVLKETFKPGNLLQATKDIGNYVYDTAGNLIAPGITHEELRNPQILKDTALGIPKAAYQVAKQAITHPLETSADIITSTIHGLSNTITNGIINVSVPKEDREATKAQVEQTLNKYLRVDTTNPVRQGISEGYKVAGSAAPFIAAGGIGGELLGKAGFAATNMLGGSLPTAAKVIGASQAIGTTAGFLGAGQTQVPIEATVQERAKQLMNDLVGLGLFALGSKAYDMVKTRATTAIRESLTPKQTAEFPTSDPTGITKPAEVPKIETQFPKSQAEITVPDRVVQVVSSKGTETSISKAKASGQSFDEWVKGQGETFYHGTPKANVTELKPGGLKGTRGENTVPGVSVTNDFDTASYYARKNGVQINAPMEVRINGKVLKAETLKDLQKELGISDWSDVTRAKVPNLLKEKGYVGFQIKGSGDVGEIIVTNLDSLKTRSQLKAEWEKIPSKTITASESKQSGQSFDEWVKIQNDPLLEFKKLGTVKDGTGAGTVKEAINDIGGINNVRRGEAPIGRLETTENINTNSQRYKAIEAEVKSGKITPIITDEYLRVMDGHHRLGVYKAMGMKEVPVIVPKETAGVKFKTRSQLKAEWDGVGKPKVKPETKSDEFQSRVFERMKAEKPEALSGDLKVERRNMEIDAQKAVEKIASDKQGAYEIAMGQKEASDVTSTAVNIALAEKALAEKNYELFNKLTIQRSLEQTRRGQELVAEKGSVTNNSASRYLKELIAQKLDKLGESYTAGLKDLFKKKGTKKKATEVIDNEVAKLEKKIKNKKLNVKEALSLLDELTCI